MLILNIDYVIHILIPHALVCMISYMVYISIDQIITVLSIVVSYTVNGIVRHRNV